MANPDPVKVRYVIRQKELGKSIKKVVAEMKTGGRWVQKLYAGYRKTGEIPTLKKPGRSKTAIADRMCDIVYACFMKYGIGAVGKDTGQTSNPHTAQYNSLYNEGVRIGRRPKKSRERKWIRYERTYSNTVWYTDYKPLMTAGGL